MITIYINQTLKSYYTLTFITVANVVRQAKALIFKINVQHTIKNIYKLMLPVP